MISIEDFVNACAYRGIRFQIFSIEDGSLLYRGDLAHCDYAELIFVQWRIDGEGGLLTFDV